MTEGAAIDLLGRFLHVALFVTTPILGACLVVGVLVGILQTATQINEGSVAYFAKLVGVTALLLVGSAPLAAQAIGYTRECIGAIAEVTR